MTNTASHRITSHITKDLLFDEIRHVVAEAIGQRTKLRVWPHAIRLSKTYPSAGLSEARIADEIIFAASRAQVPVDIQRPPEAAQWHLGSPNAAPADPNSPLIAETNVNRVWPEHSPTFSGPQERGSAS